MKISKRRNVSRQHLDLLCPFRCLTLGAGRARRRALAVCRRPKPSLYSSFQVPSFRGKDVEGRHCGTIFGTLMLAAIGGGAAGPWVTGLLYDATGGYTLAFWIAIGCGGLSAVAIW